MAVTFFEERLDVNISAGAKGGPTVPGRVKTYLPGGVLQQNFTATAPVHKFDVGYAIRSAADIAVIQNMFFVVMFTPYIGFRFKYWADYVATQTNSKLTNISGSTWQLQRAHTIGSVTFLRDIKKPCATPTPVIKRTTGMTVTTATATLDLTTGIATISGHTTGDTYTWEGEFDLPVQFSDDDWPGTLEVNQQDPHVQSASIALEELLLP